MYFCLNNFWRRNIISCVIWSPADYMAEWENVPLDPRNKKKQEGLLKLALQAHRSADYKAVLGDSSITVDKTSLDQHKLFLLVIFVP